MPRYSVFPGLFCIALFLPRGVAEVPSGQARKIFPADAIVNVTLPPYGARPDDDGDDTAAIQRAITENVDTGRVLYFPAGTYVISDTLEARNAGGFWRAHLTLQGESRASTIFRLRDRCVGFDHPASPKAMLATGSHWQEGDGQDGGGNKAFRNNVFDLSFETGTENPGAIGIAYAVSNQGAIKNVTIRSGDGAGRAGISLLRRIPGPGLIKNVTIEGFDSALEIDDVQYGLTIEHLHIRGQKAAGLLVGRNLLHIRGLQSENDVPAILVTDRSGVVTLLDSHLSGRGGDAVTCAGTFLGRNVTVTGYTGIRLRERKIPAPLPREFSEPASLGGASTLSMPIEEAPEYWNADLDDWQAVGSRREGEIDDTAAIQRALDAGKQTVYLPNTRAYFLSDTLNIRAPVRQILGMGSEISLGGAAEPFGNRENPRPLFRITAEAPPELHIENVFFNAQYPGEVLFENCSPGTVVIRHCAGWVGTDGLRRSYRNSGRGRLFVEDVFLPGWEFANQTVWARQFNPENPDGRGPQVVNRGGALWILGFKTEGPAPFLQTSGQARTELLGGYNYVSATAAPSVPAEAVPYLVEDSAVSLSFATDNFRDSDYPVYIRETSRATVMDWKRSDLPPRSGHAGDRSFALPIFRSQEQ